MKRRRVTGVNVPAVGCSRGQRQAVKPELDIGWTSPDGALPNLLKSRDFLSDGGMDALLYKGTWTALDQHGHRHCHGRKRISPPDGGRSPRCLTNP